MPEKITRWFRDNLVFVAWIIALGATLGSLALSEIWDLEPCKLCWFQRIFMFSSAIVLGVGEYFKDKHVYRYVLPLVVPGGLIAFYHSLLQWGIVKESSLTCSVTNSCAIADFEWLGFINIPFLSFVGFAAITALMLLQRKNLSQDS